MILIGERINSSSAAVREAIEARNAAAITELARTQADAGAAYLDVNAGMLFAGEAERLEWLIRVIQGPAAAYTAAAADAVQTAVTGPCGGVSVPFSIDTPNPAALARAIAANKNGRPLVNSITAEDGRYRSMLPLVREYGARVVALCMDGGGVPEDARHRVRIAGRLIDRLTSEGVDIDDIFIDPIVRPIAAGYEACVATLDTIREVRRLWPDVHIVCGVSNISYGMPSRKLMNRTFLVAAAAAGMDAAIVDLLDERLTACVCAIDALTGEDAGCARLLARYRAGTIEDF